MASISASTKVDAGYTWQLRLDYTITQDEPTYSSKIVCTLYVKPGSAGGYNLENESAYYVICGKKTYKTYEFNSTDWVKLGSRTITVKHEVDGSKEYELSASWVSDNKTNYTPAKISVAKTITLPKINRKLAWVNVEGTNVRAVPWININGTWKTFIPWVRQNNTWRSFDKIIEVEDSLLSVEDDGQGNVIMTSSNSTAIEHNNGDVYINVDCFQHDVDGNVTVI